MEHKFLYEILSYLNPFHLERILFFRPNSDELDRDTKIYHRKMFLEIVMHWYVCIMYEYVRIYNRTFLSKGNPQI